MSNLCFKEIQSLNSSDISIKDEKNIFLGNFLYSSRNLAVYSDKLYLLRDDRILTINIKCHRAYFSNDKLFIILHDGCGKFYSLENGVFLESPFTKDTLSCFTEYDDTLVELITGRCDENTRTFYFGSKTLRFTSDEVFLNETFITNHCFSSLEGIIYTYFNDVVIVGTKDSEEFIYIKGNEQILVEDIDSLALRHTDDYEFIYATDILFFNNQIYIKDTENFITIFSIIKDGSSLEPEILDRRYFFKEIGIFPNEINENDIEKLLGEYSDANFSSEKSISEVDNTYESKPMFLDFSDNRSLEEEKDSTSESTIEDDEKDFKSQFNIKKDDVKQDDEIINSSVNKSFHQDLLELNINASTVRENKRTIEKECKLSMDEIPSFDSKEEKINSVSNSKFPINNEDYSKLTSSEKEQAEAIYSSLKSLITSTSTKDLNEKIKEFRVPEILEIPNTSSVGFHENLYTTLLTDPLDYYKSELDNKINYCNKILEINDDNIKKYIQSFDNVIVNGGRVKGICFETPLQSKNKFSETKKSVSKLIEKINCISISIENYAVVESSREISPVDISRIDPKLTCKNDSPNVEEQVPFNDDSYKKNQNINSNDASSCNLTSPVVSDAQALFNTAANIFQSENQTFPAATNASNTTNDQTNNNSSFQFQQTSDQSQLSSPNSSHFSKFLQNRKF